MAAISGTLSAGDRGDRAYGMIASSAGSVGRGADCDLRESPLIRGESITVWLIRREIEMADPAEGDDLA